MVNYRYVVVNNGSKLINIGLQTVVVDKRVHQTLLDVVNDL